MDPEWIHHLSGEKNTDETPPKAPCFCHITKSSRTGTWHSCCHFTLRWRKTLHGPYQEPCALSGFWVVPSARNLPTHSFTTMKFCQSKQLQPHCSKRTILVADIHTQGPLPTFVVPGRCHPTVEVYKASPPQALTKLSANSNRYSTIYLKNELSECNTPHCSSSFSNKPQQKEGEVGDA